MCTVLVLLCATVSLHIFLFHVIAHLFVCFVPVLFSVRLDSTVHKALMLLNHVKLERMVPLSSWNHKQNARVVTQGSFVGRLVWTRRQETALLVISAEGMHPWLLHLMMKLVSHEEPFVFICTAQWIAHWWMQGNFSYPWRSRFQASTCFILAFNVRFIWPPTCVDLRWLWSSSNFVRKSTRDFHRLATQRKSTQVDHKSTVHWICVKFTTFCDLRELVRWLTNPFGRPSQVRSQVLLYKLGLTCVKLRVRLASGFMLISVGWYFMLPYYSVSIG